MKSAQSEARFDGVEPVHFVLETHLDIDFTDLAAVVVVRRYVGEFVPCATRLASRTREEGWPRFVWTLGSWLVHECPARADGPRRAELDSAVVEGRGPRMPPQDALRLIALAQSVVRCYLERRPIPSPTLATAR